MGKILKTSTGKIIMLDGACAVMPEAAEPDYLTFEAVEDTSIRLDYVGYEGTIPVLEYSLNGGAWTTLSNLGLTLAARDKIHIRGDHTTFSESLAKHFYFNSSGQVKVSGNIMSLLDKTCKRLDVPAYAFTYLFGHGYLHATDASKLKLPATALGDHCYQYMFQGCTNLTSAPELPATALSERCYYNMFYGCTSLTTPPKLPATTLVKNCYQRMFQGCTSLEKVPELPAMTLMSKNCYSYMFYGCTSLQVSDTQTAEASHPWHIPTSGTFQNVETYNQVNMFTGCLGTRSSDDMSGAQGESHTYYIQHEPI